MQKSVAKTIQIITSFIFEARIEKAILIANLVLLFVTGSKISLPQLAIAISHGKHKPKSSEQKIRRLLEKFPITALTYAKAVISLFTIESTELIIDRTNWQFGIVDINFLVLSIRWHNIGIPVYWIMLHNKGGNSSSEQSIALVRWFISNFNTKIINIYADREFPSVEFISWLIHKEQNLNFIFRCKNSINASNGDKRISIKKLYGQLLHQQHRSVVEKRIRRIFGNRLYISARINEKHDYVFLISNQYHKDPFELYSHRWNIETMFGNFKSKSFDIESTHMTKHNRLSALFLLMAIAYCYSCKLGYIVNKIQPITIKSLKRFSGKIEKKPELTIFKYGFYLLKNFFDNLLCDSAVVTRQLYNILNYPPDTKIPEDSQIYKIIMKVT